MTPRTFTRLAAAIAVWAAAFWPVAARADYQNSYRQGIEAINRKNWADAARFMHEAMQEKPVEGEQVRLYGMNFTAYLPSYYLGVALFNQGDCAGAVAAWDAAEAAGAIRGKGEYKNLQRDRRTCAEKLAAQKPRTAEPGAAAPRATQVAEASRTAPSAPSPAKPTPAAATKAAEAIPTLKLSPVKSPPPPELVAAARAYFGGEYRQAIDKLSTIPSGRAAAQGYVFRAASRYALWVLGGEKDASLKKAAQDDVQALRRLDASFTPDERAFSPRFREFYQKSL